MDKIDKLLFLKLLCVFFFSSFSAIYDSYLSFVGHKQTHSTNFWQHIHTLFFSFANGMTERWWESSENSMTVIAIATQLCKCVYSAVSK